MKNDLHDGAGMIAEGFRAHDNLVKPHIALDGRTPGDVAGMFLPDGFRWKAILDTAITRQVTSVALREGQPESPD